MRAIGALAMSSVSISRPSRRTVTLSATRAISSMRCET